MTDPARPLVRSFLFLRRGVGMIGTLLPFVLVIGTLLVNGELLYSISGYYHSPLRDVYVGGLCAVGVFLLFYRGYDRTDWVASIVAGVAAIGTALFPIPSGPADTTEDVIGYLHIGFAAVLFLTFAYFCLFEFRKTGALPPTPRKLMRNKVYLAAGVVILVCLALIVLAEIVGLPDELRPALWLEFVATLAFGVAWATKGLAILADVQG